MKQDYFCPFSMGIIGRIGKNNVSSTIIWTMHHKTHDVGIDYENLFGFCALSRACQAVNIFSQTSKDRPVVFNKTRERCPAAERLQSESAGAGKEIKDSRSRYMMMVFFLKSVM